jgi:hypothetical protein
MAKVEAQGYGYFVVDEDAFLLESSVDREVLKEILSPLRSGGRPSALLIVGSAKVEAQGAGIIPANPTTGFYSGCANTKRCLRDIEIGIGHPASYRVSCAIGEVSGPFRLGAGSSQGSASNWKLRSPVPNRRDSKRIPDANRRLPRKS